MLNHVRAQEEADSGPGAGGALRTRNHWEVVTPVTQNMYRTVSPETLAIVYKCTTQVEPVVELKVTGQCIFFSLIKKCPQALAGNRTFLYQHEWHSSLHRSKGST